MLNKTLNNELIFHMFETFCEDREKDLFSRPMRKSFDNKHAHNKIMQIRRFSPRLLKQGMERTLRLAARYATAQNHNLKYEKIIF